ncbi:hypothetical protein D030_3813B, partial [Vibrio parahaemolyticus AQ3810]
CHETLPCLRLKQDVGTPCL